MPANQSIQIYPVTVLSSAEMLRPIYEDCVRFPMPDGPILEDEVQEDIDAVQDSMEGLSERRYLIAQNASGLTLGVMGLQPPTETMMQFTKTPRPVELINAYALKDQRHGKGVGGALLGAIEVLAAQQGHTEVILNSGPRYKETGWPFWRAKYGTPAAVSKDHYGPGLDSMVWRKELHLLK